MSEETKHGRERGDNELMFEGEVGRRIAEKREARGWTQTDLGNYIGVHYNTILRWEKGDSISIWMFMRICDALSIQPMSMVPPHAQFLGAEIRRLERERDGTGKQIQRERDKALTEADLRECYKIPPGRAGAQGERTKRA